MIHLHFNYISINIYVIRADGNVCTDIYFFNNISVRLQLCVIGFNFVKFMEKILTVHLTLSSNLSDYVSLIKSITAIIVFLEKNNTRPCLVHLLWTIYHVLEFHQYHVIIKSVKSTLTLKPCHKTPFSFKHFYNINSHQKLGKVKLD